MMSQLIIFVLVFLIPAAYLFISRYKKIPHIVKEESTDSREFWMFIGALVIFLSSLFIIITTSLPVINKIFGSKFSEGSDREFAYNRIEVFIAILLGLFTAIAQYLKYKNTKKDTFLKKIALPTAIALVISILISIFGEVRYDKYGMGFLIAIHLAIFAAVYAIAANAAYIRTGLNGKLKAAGGSIAHLGFGLLLLGILISSSRKAVLSYNTTGINLNFDPGAKENPLENITLLKSVKTDMGKYWATYIDGDSVNARDKTMYFHVNFRKKDDGEVFDLYPNWIRSTKGQESISANPDKHHYWNRDIFTYISASNNMEQQAEDTVQFRNYPVAIHDTIYYSRGYMVLDRVVVNPDSGKYHFTPSDTALMAEVRVFSKDSVRSMVRPLFYLKDNQYHWVADTVFSQGLAVRFNKVVGNNKIELGVKESSSMVPFVALKVYEFPHINIVWIGVMVMMIGFVMSIARRYKLSGG
jgi:cytochrome c-type biogenesis protein CcmF